MSSMIVAPKSDIDMFDIFLRMPTAMEPRAVNRSQPKRSTRKLAFGSASGLPTDCFESDLRFCC
eukprot:2616701-Alexandrium_andersonii.AAC.1